MRAFIATGILGSFAFGERGKTLEYRLFPKKPDVIAGKLKKSFAGEALPEELEIIKVLSRKGYKEIVWKKKAQVRGITCIQIKENPGEETMQGSYRKLAMDLRWVTTQAELNEILSKVNIEMTKTQLRKEKRDQIIMRVVSVLDELDKELNVFSEKLREWYGLHFPEADSRVSSNERYAEIIAGFGRRESIEDKELESLASKSSGMDLGEQDIIEVQSFSKTLISLFDEKKRLSKYLEQITRVCVPNLSNVAGPILTARLLVLSGGLEKMAKLPSSTIQLLGAEKALFRHLKGEGKPPKYGILFGHPLIQSAPRELKGKVARLVASKVCLAARMDNFSDKDVGESIRKELEQHVENIVHK
jgi:nucleolar protein 56